MEKRPLRAVILDNDETTGSYGILFAYIEAFKHDKVLTYNYLAGFFHSLAVWMYQYNIFRPGILNLLRKLKELKKSKSIDAVIMYTNQTDGKLQTKYLDEQGAYPDFLNSPARTIAYMLECLLGENLFDHILVRPSDLLPDKNGYYPKTFERVLNLYPERPKDITQCIFIDDYACPQFIKADGMQVIHEDAWYCISPHIRVLSEYDILNCVNMCFHDEKYREMMYGHINKFYKRYKPSTKETHLTEKSIYHLCDCLDYKYVYSSILKTILDLKYMYMGPEDLNDYELFGILESDGENTSSGTEASEINGRATKRKHEHSE
jgi:hypothetical protein